MDNLIAIPLSPRVKDKTGHRFGRLRAVRFAGVLAKPPHGTEAVWECVCDCGSKVLVRGRLLANGNSKSCGCARIESITTNLGRSRMKEYRRWAGLLNRCSNPAYVGYKNYGGRGITVCDQWKRFENYYADMGDPPSASHSLHRINNDGPYSPENCKWADSKEQANCTTRSVYLTLNGITKTATLWAEEVGINPKTIQKRKRDGWSDERALTEPVRFSSRASQRSWSWA